MERTSKSPSDRLSNLVVFELINCENRSCNLKQNIAHFLPRSLDTFRIIGSTAYSKMTTHTIKHMHFLSTLEFTIYEMFGDYSIYNDAFAKRHHLMKTSGVVPQLQSLNTRVVRNFAPLLFEHISQACNRNMKTLQLELSESFCQPMDHPCSAFSLRYFLTWSRCHAFFIVV